MGISGNHRKVAATQKTTKATGKKSAECFLPELKASGGGPKDGSV